MTEVLEFSNITADLKGDSYAGKLKFTQSTISFKNNRSGKVEQFFPSDLELCNWQKLIDTWGLRLFLKNGSLQRFCGFKESELDDVIKFFKTYYKQELIEKEFSVSGWNWGTAKFSGSVLSFEVKNMTTFDIPLNNVSHCTTGKNEVTVEFHQNDEAPINLMEIRFHIPASENATDDRVAAFHSQVMQKASVISASGDAIATFREIHCLTPRGRYDIKIFSSFFQLHGKTFDYKIPMGTVVRLFVLPHKDGRQNFFVISLDPPIKQGQTRYHYLVFLFGQDEDITLELPFTDEELSVKYEGQLTRELSGPTHDVLSRVMKVLVNRKITVPSGFMGHSGTAAVGCSYKAAAGYLYPLERGFIYIHKPPLHIRFEEISNVNFARGGGSTRSFDFEIKLKSGVIHTFNSIEKEEYGKLFDFINRKKLHIKNKKPEKPSYTEDKSGESEDEKEPDAYLARVKREGEERDENEDGGDSSDGSTDEDFKPQEFEESDVAEEYDSNPSSSDSNQDSSEDTKIGDAEKKENKKKQKPTTILEKPLKKRSKKQREDDKPKRAPSAYMLWFNENREKIKTDNPGISFTDIGKKGGELWKQMEDKSEWEQKAAMLKEEYKVAMSAYEVSQGTDKNKEEKSSSKKKSMKVKATGSLSSSPEKKSFISREYIDDTDSSSDSDAAKKSVERTKKDAQKSVNSSNKRGLESSPKKRRKSPNEENLIMKDKKNKPVIEVDEKEKLKYKANSFEEEGENKVTSGGNIKTDKQDDRSHFDDSDAFNSTASSGESEIV